MIVEVLIYNVEVMVVVVDSVIMVGGKRVWEYGNKVFFFGFSYIFGIMYNNNVEVVGILWEILIKVYKKNVRFKLFFIVIDLSVDFVSFVDVMFINVWNLEELFILCFVVDVFEGILGIFFEEVEIDGEIKLVFDKFEY